MIKCRFLPLNMNRFFYLKLEGGRSVRWPIRDMAFRDQIFKLEILSLETRNFVFTNSKFCVHKLEICASKLEISSLVTGQCKMQTAD